MFWLDEGNSESEKKKLWNRVGRSFFFFFYFVSFSSKNPEKKNRRRNLASCVGFHQKMKKHRWMVLYAIRDDVSGVHASTESRTLNHDVRSVIMCCCIVVLLWICIFFFGLFFQSFNSIFWISMGFLIRLLTKFSEHQHSEWHLIFYSQKFFNQIESNFLFLLRGIRKKKKKLIKFFIMCSNCSLSNVFRCSSFRSGSLFMFRFISIYESI